MHVAQFEDRSGPLIGIRAGRRWINYGKAERVMYMLRHDVTARDMEPGDVISTGTPEGIGPITNGDVMVCRIQGVGELRNPVRWR
jgi:hypothetical protein